MQKWIPLFILSLTILIFCCGPAPARADLNQQRQDFQAAEKALNEGRLQDFNRLLSRLRDYPLYPYLVYEQLSKNISIQKEKQILDFLDKYDSTPLADRLRRLWLEYLAEHNRWTELVRDFHLPYTPGLHCSYARGLMETGRTGEAWQEARDLWLRGRSLPDECDPVFDKWRQEDGLTVDLVWQRTGLAIDQGQTNLARYLRRYLPADQQPWLDLWLEVIKKPSRTLAIDWSGKTHPVAEKILAHGMSRLIKEDTRKALDQWKKLETGQNLQSMDVSSVKQELALYLALRKHPQALEYISSLSGEIITPALRQWQIRSALYEGKWKQALSALDKLDNSLKELPRWIYWKARVLEQLGHQDEAARLYQSILHRQNYFSVLAGDRINQTCRIQHRPISSFGPDILELNQDQGIMRAAELLFLGRTVDARREWNSSISGKNAPELRAAAVLAHDMGWHDRAIVAAARAGEFEDLIIRFPVPYSGLINKHSRSTGLDPAWVFALARQESMFMADVGSPAGALGIMQIMPSTGRRIASLKNEQFASQYVLLNPETNIRFGTFYLKKRLGELQNNPVLATAAYNAGAHRVREWLPDEKNMAADIWVENIPYYETRGYVEKVFLYKYIYEKRLNMPSTGMAALMSDIQGKNTIPDRASLD
ncbi:MAG: transglycosylase SLT domain-containing protein [Desulfonatronovibrio sp.]